jgi:hypothetical protein
MEQSPSLEANRFVASQEILSFHLRLGLPSGLFPSGLSDIYKKGKGYPITGHQGPRGRVEV